MLDWLYNMATTKIITTVRTSRFSRERQMLESRLEQLFSEARSIEDALDVPSRILVGAPPESSVFEEPRGKIMRKVWEYIIAHPGQTSPALRKALKMDEVQMATALNTLLRKNKQVMIRGRRGPTATTR